MTAIARKRKKAVCPPIGALMRYRDRTVRVVAVTARSKAKKRSVDLGGIEWAKSPQALAEHPGIAEIAVVGLPDERTGERACAVIVPAGSVVPDVAGLLALLQNKGVAKFKAPEQVVIWDALPKNDAGKILKHRIRAVLTQDG